LLPLPSASKREGGDAALLPSRSASDDGEATGEPTTRGRGGMFSLGVGTSLGLGGGIDERCGPSGAGAAAGRLATELFSPVS